MAQLGKDTSECYQSPAVHLMTCRPSSSYLRKVFFSPYGVYVLAYVTYDVCGPCEGPLTVRSSNSADNGRMVSNGRQCQPMVVVLCHRCFVADSLHDYKPNECISAVAIINNSSKVCFTLKFERSHRHFLL